MFEKSASPIPTMIMESGKCEEATIASKDY
jgi:hypothetical protein